MVVLLDDLVREADRLLNVAAFDEGAPSNGLLVRASREAIDRIGSSVNTSFEAIEGAHAADVEILFVHHTSWPHIDLHLRDRKEELLRSYGISLYGAHASLDCLPEFGTGSSLAKQIGMTVQGTFAEYQGGQAGVHGRVEGTFEGLIERLLSSLGAAVRAQRNSDAFGHVAIVTGAGGLTSWLAEARALGADTYLTGEGSMYTDLFAKEVGLNVIMGTHYATEAPGIKALSAELSRRLGIDWRFIAETNPSL